MVPEVGDVIFVPDSIDPNSFIKKFCGGYATISRVVSALSKNNEKIYFICVVEHTGYKEYCWLDLEPIQNELRNKYTLENNIINRAYIIS